MASRIVIASGKGGVGKSSVAAGLSCALQRAGHSVLVVDCDIGLKSLDIILGAGENMLYNWGDIICGRCNAQDALTQTSCGPMLLCAPNSFEDEFTPDAMKKLVENYEEMFDYIFFDSPAGIGRGVVLAASAATSAIVVATSDEVCVRSGAIAAEKLAGFGIEQSRLIINRFNKKATIRGGLLNIDDVIDSTRLRLLGVVPHDNALAFSLCAGKSLPARSSAYKAFRRISDRLDGKRVPLKID